MAKNLNVTNTEWSSQLRRGVLEMCILAIIERRPGYGYEIVTELADAAQLAAGEGTVYPLLRRLKKDGFVETFWQESAAGPPRQYYKITPRGIGALATMRAEWRELLEAMTKYQRTEISERSVDPAKRDQRPPLRPSDRADGVSR
jgi:PadR family transcriptional regulator PadR